MSDLQQQQLAIVEATSAVCAERGYPGATDVDISRRAGIGVESFRRVFPDKEDAFLALLSIEEGRLLGRVEGGCVETAGPVARIERGIRTVLAWVDENPRDARVCIVESTRATIRIFERREQTLDRLAALLRSNVPPAAPGSPPDLLENLLIAGVCELLGDRLNRREEGRAIDLAPELIELFLRPYPSLSDP